MKTLSEILHFAIQNNASDVHLSSGMYPMLRVLGKIKSVTDEPIPHRQLEQMLREILDEEQRQKFENREDIDFSFTMPGVARVRVNIFHHFEGISAAFRVLPSRIRSLEELHMPPVLKELCKRKKGMILVTGPTGSGKSSTLAAMIHQINMTRSEHIITIEDPIEYVHASKYSIIHQREVGTHTRGFAESLRSALREDPDIILVGEMRDLETISQALTAAETGHLVLSTLHTNSAPETIDRIVDAFPGEQQTQIRVLLANVLVAVISQRLIPMQFKQDRIALMEILIGSKAVGNLIREGKSHQLSTVMQTGSEFGMQTFEQHFKKLVQQNLVSPNLNLGDYL